MPSLDRFAMGMIFDSNNIPQDLMRNGAYQAFAVLGKHWNIGNVLVTIYALTQFIGQTATLALSIDAPLQIFLVVPMKNMSLAGFVHAQRTVH